MPNLPLVFKTYQDVKNNLVYWTVLLLLTSTAIIYFLFLNPTQQQSINGSLTTLGANGFLATVAAGLFLAAYATVAVILVYGIQIHDVIYDRFVIKWRERFDVEFILSKLTEPFKQDLPRNFPDIATRYRQRFMGPYYHFVGDRKPGIAENTRIRFYERVTWYWVTQLNEIFLLVFLIGTPIYTLAVPSSGFTLSSLAGFMLVLIPLWLINRWLIRVTLRATSQATLDEVEEILEKPENVQLLKERYTKLCQEIKV